MLTQEQFELYFPEYTDMSGIYTIYTDSHQPGEPYILSAEQRTKVNDLIANLGFYYKNYFKTVGCRLNVLVDLVCIGYLDHPEDVNYTRLQIDSFLKNTKCLSFNDFVTRTISIDPETDYIDNSIYCLVLYDYASRAGVKWLEDTYMFDPSNNMQYTVEDVQRILDDVFKASKLSNIGSYFNDVEIL